MDSINAPESSEELTIPTHLVGILEAGTAVTEHVRQVLDLEEDNCSGGARAHNRSLRV